MKLIPVEARIDTRPFPKAIKGFAFQVPGFEFVRTFTHRRGIWHGTSDEWITSEWLSGCSIGRNLFYGDSPIKAANAVARYFRSKGKKEIRRLYEINLDKWARGLPTNADQVNK